MTMITATPPITTTPAHSKFSNLKIDIDRSVREWIEHYRTESPHAMHRITQIHRPSSSQAAGRIILRFAQDVSRIYKHHPIPDTNRLDPVATGIGDTVSGISALCEKERADLEGVGRPLGRVVKPWRG